jgi:hypothetical protein
MGTPLLLRLVTADSRKQIIHTTRDCPSFSYPDFPCFVDRNDIAESCTFLFDF